MKIVGYKPLILGLILILQVTLTAPLAALPTPSKTASDQSLADRQIELGKIQAVLSQPEVAESLAQHGWSESEIHHRLAQLSPEEIHALSSQIDQLQAAGAAVPQYIWILLAVLLGVLILTALV